MKEAPRNPDEGIFSGGLLKDVLFRGILITIAVVISTYFGFQHSPEVAVAMAFTTLILARTLQVFAARSSTKTAFQLGIMSNKYVVYAFLICMGLYVITILPGVRSIFDIPTSFTFQHWLIAAGLALAAVILMEVKKLIFNRGE